MRKGDLYSGIGRRVADVRTSVGMTQAQLAAAVGSTQAVISQIERGAGVPSLARVAAIADALDVSIAELFTFERAAPKRAAHDAALARLTSVARRLSVSDVETVLKMAEALARRPRKK